MGNSKAKHEGRDSDLLTGSLVITRSIYKYALFAFVFGGVCAIAWMLYGSIPHRVEGMGEVNTKRGLFKVTSVYGGQIGEKNISINDNVVENQVLFLLKQPEFENSIREAEDELTLLKSEKRQLKSGNARSFSLKSDVNKIETKRIHAQITESKKTISFLQKKLKQNQKLYDNGLITYSNLFNIEKSLAEEMAGLVGLEKNLLGVTLTTQEWKLGKDLSEQDVENEIRKLSKKIVDLKSEYRLNTEVSSSVVGVVVLMNVDIGNEVSPGMHLATIELPDNLDNYLLDLYIPFSANAEIGEGMEVEIEPFTVDRNLYGWLNGTVLDVNRYVSSGVGLANELANNNLAGLIDEKGPVYKITVKLETDPSTKSGFAWSNKKGPPFQVSLGTLCKAYVKVKEKAPIDYLIPIFKAYFE